MDKKRVLPYLAIVFVMVIWGISFLSIKVTVNVLGAMTLAFSRFAIASVLLMIFLKIREPKTRLMKKDIPRMGLAGIVGISLYFFLENNGVKMTTASTASIIIATIPIFTILADYIFRGNRITLPKGLGVIFSFAGVYLIVGSSGKLDFSSRYFVGNMLMFGAALSWVLYSMLTKPLEKNYSGLAITTYQTVIATIVILPFTFFEQNQWSEVNMIIVANILFLGIFCSALGYFLYIYTIRELGIGLVSIFVNLIPVITIICSYLVLDEKITPIQLVGGGIIIFAVYMVDLSNRLIEKKNTTLSENQG